ncbi:hypothetical protein PG996_002544 [Apiospora saccharicola]|uniref:PinX1-related protein 1 n=1 Tax=Apiospora saccharicola TaxID=335842 RepID=A0ABR1WP25_9PEZI
MGLAGQKTKRKLAFDPNNTKWSRDETTFGQKILRSHGWEPGQFLGAQDSAHADLHSAASAAPIRITLKDDTLGLGAKVRQKQSDECTGLDVFKDLLGRLNGKSDDTIKKEQTLRSELKTSTYVERKFGLMRFVKGGLLVGDQMTDLLKKEEPVDVKEDPVKEESKDELCLRQVPAQEDDETSRPKKEKKSKKRKAEESEGTEEPEVKKEKKSKKSKREETEDERKARKEKKKSKKSKSEEAEDEEKSKSKKSKKRKNETADEADSASEEASDSKKKQKKDKKEKKRKQREASDASSEEVVATDVTVASTPTATPVESGTSTPQALSTRHFVRSRNIASKRRALDATALAQIFMVKPV